MYCPNCGVEFPALLVAPFACFGCKKMHWENPYPVLAGLIPVRSTLTRRIGLITVIRTIEPEIGGECLPCGYLETRDGDWTNGLRREIGEETRIPLRRIDLVQPYDVRTAVMGTILTVFGLTEMFEEASANWNDLTFFSAEIPSRRKQDPIQLLSYLWTNCFAG